MHVGNHDRGIGHGLGDQKINSFQIGERILYLLGYGGLHFIRRSTRIARLDDQHRLIEIRHQFIGQIGKANIPQEDKQAEQHDDQRGPIDGYGGNVHRSEEKLGSTFAPSNTLTKPPTMTTSPGLIPLFKRS